MATQSALHVLPWKWLFDRARNQCVAPVERDWNSLLDQFSRETELTQFVARHAGLFFDAPETHFVLSELGLGGEYSVDLVVPKDQASLGLEYCLIELERPDSPALRSNGHPTERLSHALGQIADWQRWIKRNHEAVRHIFPAPAQIGPSFDIAFRYIVVIGRRDDAPRHLPSRNQFSEMTNVEIRSFDWLTDLLRNSRPRPSGPLTPSAEANSLSFEVTESLKNPLYSAFSASAWRGMLPSLKVHPHLVSVNASLFAQERPVDSATLERFREYCAEASADLDEAIAMERELFSQIVKSRTL